MDRDVHAAGAFREPLHGESVRERLLGGDGSRAGESGDGDGSGGGEGGRRGVSCGGARRRGGVLFGCEGGGGGGGDGSVGVLVGADFSDGDCDGDEVDAAGAACWGGGFCECRGADWGGGVPVCCWGHCG